MFILIFEKTLTSLKRIAVFGSGSGSNAENVCAYFSSSKDISVAFFCTNNKNAFIVERAKKLNVPVPVIESSFDFRVASEGNPSYTGKVLSMLRNMFGGHDAEKK